MILLSSSFPGRALARLRAALGRWRRDTRGTYAIEFALVAVPFLGLICATTEVAWVSFNAEQLQAAVSNASRQILTGQAQAANITTAANFVAKLLCPTDGTRKLPSYMDCSKLIVDIRTATDFTSADVSKAFYTQPLKFCLGQPKTIVIVRVVYPMDVIFPLSISNQYVGLANNVPTASGWKHVLMGSAAFQTEPYGGSATC